MNLWNKFLSVAIQMKSYSAVLSCVAVYWAAQGDRSGLSLSMDPSNATIQMKSAEKIFQPIFVL